jgi:hypothetical protein
MKTLSERFEDAIVRIPEGGCWIWMNWVNHYGYGQIQNQNKGFGTHRVAWTLYIGPIPDGMNVCHRCDNPACCNPHHLFLGTTQDNVQDKIDKGRGRGWTFSRSAPTTSKLSVDDVLWIRENYKGRGDGVKFAAKFNVTPALITAILKRKVWVDI